MRFPPGARATRERGASLVVTMMLIVALLGAGALALQLMVADTHAAQWVVDRRTAMYCAESGLAGARDYIGSHATSWAAMLDASTANDPVGYPVTGDVDGDGHVDWRVTIKDNDDDFPTNNPAVDSDGVVFMVSDCIANPDVPRQVMELVSVGGGGTNYRTQAGAGGGNTGNSN